MSETIDCRFCGAVVRAVRGTDEDGREVMEAKCPNCGRWCGFAVGEDGPAPERKPVVTGWRATVRDNRGVYSREFATEEEAEAFARSAYGEWTWVRPVYEDE